LKKPVLRLPLALLLLAPLLVGQEDCQPPDVSTKLAVLELVVDGVDRVRSFDPDVGHWA